VNKITWASGVDLKTGRPVELGNRPGDPTKGGGEGGKGTTVWTIPNFLGGKNWNPVAYSHDTGLFYVPANEWGMDIWNEPVTYKKGAAYLGAGFTIKPVYDDYIGALKAVDPATGKIVWEYHNPGVLWGGVLATHGNLVFTGTPEGYLKAFDAKTGKELWVVKLGAAAHATPSTYLARDGRQYVVITSTGGGFLDAPTADDSITAFALPPRK
jgi:alcohol dehydrogenase (cytochrome c)